MEKCKAIIKLHQAGYSCRAIVEALKPIQVSKSNVSYTIRRFKETNSLSDRPKLGQPRSVHTKRLVEAKWMKIHCNKKRAIRTWRMRLV